MKLIFGFLSMAAAAAAAGDDANAKRSLGSIRDSSFYRPGFVNPALENPLYHKSAKSVLENLDNFQALYIKYENCAWANYGQPYAEKRGEQGENEDGFEYGEQVLGCGAARGGDEYWYMGRTPCFRAQAAYSLYGIPKDDSSGSTGSKCQKATFINSFFTTMGVEAFAAPLGVDTTYGNSYCTVYPPSDGGAIYDDDANAQGHHDTKYNFAAFTSAGTGCSRNRFVKDTYGGAFCDGNDHVETTDTLDSFNEALEDLDCVQIYDTSTGYYYENDDDGEDNHDDNQEAVDFTALDNTVEILEYSITCDVGQYPGVCPDPYGLLSKYNSMLQSALAKVDIWNKSAGEKAMNAFTGILFFLSLLLGLAIIRKRRRITRMSKAPLPPPANDDPSVVSSSAASSTAPSVHSVQKQVDQEGTYQSPEVTKQPSFVGSIVSSVAASVAASISSALPNAAPEEPKEGAYQAVPEVTKQTSFLDEGTRHIATTMVRVGSIVSSVAETAGGAGEEPAPKMPTKKKKKSGLFSRFRKQPKTSHGALEVTGTY